MELNIEDIRHLADLSALEFTDKELENFKNEFNNILKFVDKINSADVPDELEYKEIKVSELRVDEPRQPLSQAEVLTNAQSKKFGGFAVPLMME